MEQNIIIMNTAAAAEPVHQPVSLFFRTMRNAAVPAAKNTRRSRTATHRTVTNMVINMITVTAMKRIIQAQYS